MREGAVTPKDQVPHRPFEEPPPERDEVEGIDGWMTAVRGFVVLVIGLMLVGLFTTI